jgi:hypothetical protein
LHFLGVADYVHKKTPDLILWGVATLRVSVRRWPDPSSRLKPLNFYHA